PAKAAKAAAEHLERERNSSSRLFAVDAGRDVSELRAKYPDRARYAIVHGKVRLYYQGNPGTGPRWEGHIDGVSDLHINVPQAFRPTLIPLPDGMAWENASSRPSLAVTVAFGKRFEPWIVDGSTSR